MRYLILFLLFKCCVCQSASLDELIWLEGSWRSENSHSYVMETWNKISHSTFEGRSDTFRLSDSEVMDSESLRLVFMSGDIFYIAKVNHNEYPVSFKLISVSSNTCVFENKNHDFPSRIEYTLSTPSILKVKVSGKEREFLLKFNKISEN